MLKRLVEFLTSLEEATPAQMNIVDRALDRAAERVEVLYKLQADFEQRFRDAEFAKAERRKQYRQDEKDRYVLLKSRERHLQRLHSAAALNPALKQALAEAFSWTTTLGSEIEQLEKNYGLTQSQRLSLSVIKSWHVHVHNELLPEFEKSLVPANYQKLEQHCREFDKFDED